MQGTGRYSNINAFKNANVPLNILNCASFLIFKNTIIMVSNVLCGILCGILSSVLFIPIIRYVYAICKYIFIIFNKKLHKSVDIIRRISYYYDKSCRVQVYINKKGVQIHGKECRIKKLKGDFTV